MKHLSLFFIAAFLLLGFHSCVDNEIDEPPIKDVPQLETNGTIADILASRIDGQNIEITEDITFDAVVVADDESGNFYKNIVVEDETGGMTIRIEANNVYTLLPVGRRLYVHAQGLYVGDYNGLPQIGFGDDEGSLQTIPFSLIGDSEESKIIPAERDQTVTPATHTINTLGNSALNTLIILEDVQFASNELGKSYADAENQSTENREVEDCDGNSIIVRTSGFSDFAGETIAEGKGTLTCVYTIFGSTKQLVIRDPSDVQMEGTRCGVVVVDLPEPNATISDLMPFYTPGAATTITSDLIFDAIVTADDASGNFYKQIVVEDETGAMNIQIDDFDLFEKFSVGKRVVVKAQNLAIGDYNGLPQIGFDNGGSVGRIPETAYGEIVLPGEFEGEITPTSMSVTEALGSDKLNSLILLSDVEFSASAQGSTYALDGAAGEYDIVDCDGNAILLRTSSFADFAGITVSDQNGSLEAILTVFQGTKQLVIRDLGDVKFSSERCDGGGGPMDLEELSENFSSVGSDTDVNLTGWSNEVVKGVRKWRGKEFDGNTYIQATAYNDDEASMETWIVTPKIIMNGSNTLSFRSAMAFHQHDGLSVYVSTDYNGDATSATWTELSASLAGSAQANYDWVESGTIDLSSYSGKAVIGFKYEGTSASNTTTYIIDDVVVTK